MESADNHILESVCLNPCPVIHFIGRDVFHVAGHIVAGVGIGAFRTDR